MWMSFALQDQFDRVSSCPPSELTQQTRWITRQDSASAQALTNCSSPVRAYTRRAGGCPCLFCALRSDSDHLPRAPFLEDGFCARSTQHHWSLPHTRTAGARGLSLASQHPGMPSHSRISAMPRLAPSNRVSELYPGTQDHKQTDQDKLYEFVGHDPLRASRRSRTGKGEPSQRRKPWARESCWRVNRRRVAVSERTRGVVAAEVAAGMATTSKGAPMSRITRENSGAGASVLSRQTDRFLVKAHHPTSSLLVRQAFASSWRSGFFADIPEYMGLESR